jgi:epoxyqueuosine reductase
MTEPIHVGNLPHHWQFLLPIAREAGAVAVGVCPASEIPDVAFERYRKWVNSPKSGELTYLRSHLDVRRNPGSDRILEGASVVVSLAFPYGQPGPLPDIWQYIAEHARGRDYHKTIRARLTRISRQIQSVHTDARFRVFVDSAPLMERTLAIRAGIGAVGRNAMLLVPGVGAKVLLGEIVLANVPGEHENPDSEFKPFALCEQCHRCQKACPTGALGEDGIVDVPRCLSYITIEAHEAVPGTRDLEQLNSFFGCDRCTSVCPRNRFVPSILEKPAVEHIAASLEEFVSMPPSVLMERLRGTCMYRTGADQLQKMASHLLRNIRRRHRR